MMRSLYLPKRVRLWYIERVQIGPAPVRRRLMQRSSLREQSSVTMIKLDRLQYPLFSCVASYGEYYRGERCPMQGTGCRSPSNLRNFLFNWPVGTHGLPSRSVFTRGEVPDHWHGARENERGQRGWVGNDNDQR